jgi:hypothetical protein
MVDRLGGIAHIVNDHALKNLVLFLSHLASHEHLFQLIVQNLQLLLLLQQERNPVGIHAFILQQI